MSSIRRLHQKVPSLVFCFDSTRSIPSMIACSPSVRRKDIAPTIPIRKLSREQLADSFSSREGSSMSNAKFESPSVASTIPMTSLVNTLGCLSPVPQTPKRPVYRLAIQVPTKADVAPTAPQRSSSHESCYSLSNDYNYSTYEEEIKENNVQAVSNLLLNNSNHSTLSKKTKPNKKRVGDLLLNISNHSTQSFLSTSSRSTAWSNHWMNASYSRIRI